MNAWRKLVQAYEQALRVPLPAPISNLKSQIQNPKSKIPNSPTALLFSPHPDDECITGALPLRLQREMGWRIVNIAITLGSDPARREARRAELHAACSILGWETIVLGWDLRTADDARVPALAALIREYRPAAIFYPHAADAHPAHLETHRLATAAAAAVPEAASLIHVQTEFWHPMAEPNLLAECPPDDLALLIEALSCHAGEVARNPYHLRLPAWMIDNVRRGAERVHGPGSPAPGFPFGTLYHVHPALPGFGKTQAGALPEANSPKSGF